MNESLYIDSAVRPKTRLRRRFSLVAAGLLSVLMAVLGVNFAADSGTSNTTVSAAGSISVTEGTTQGWSVSVGSAGTVPAPGTDDKIATITPGTTAATKMLVSIYVTNLAALSGNYSSWNFNVGLFNSSGQVGSTEVITSDSGTLSWVLDTDETYTLKLLAGGSFYTIGTTGAPADLSPKFFVRATQL